MDYPQDRYEVIIINDNSSDQSAALLAALQTRTTNGRLSVINTTPQNGGIGKSNALNIGLKQAKGTLISVYDADNTPEAAALRSLVAASATMLS
nr:glycosyltransferase [Secundilactobacillus odoratitofui]